MSYSTVNIRIKKVVVPAASISTLQQRIDSIELMPTPPTGKAYAIWGITHYHTYDAQSALISGRILGYNFEPNDPGDPANGGSKNYGLFTDQLLFMGQLGTIVPGAIKKVDLMKQSTVITAAGSDGHYYGPAPFSILSESLRLYGSGYGGTFGAFTNPVTVYIAFELINLE